MDQIAKDIIRVRDEEKNKYQGYWNSLWQDAADLVYPREDAINTKTQPGRDKSIERHDNTAVEDSKTMASSIAAWLNITAGQRFFGMKAKNRMAAQIDAVKRWLWIATEIAHEELFASNIIMHLVQSFRSLVTFGTNCIYSEFDPSAGQLNFKDHAISTYTIKEDNHGNVDTVILTYKFSAKQAVQEFGEKSLHKSIVEHAGKLDKESDKWEFITIVRPRTALNPLFKDDLNMPYECIDVDVKNIERVRERGYEENPFHVARWEKGATEKYGRGPGTDYLADIRLLQKMVKDFIDVCNLKVVPPIMASERFEGLPKLFPGAVNRGEKDDIVPINPGVTGELQPLWQAIQEQRKLIHGYFYRDVFTPITNLEGTHRTALEIEQRRQEGMKLLAAPIMNVQSELITPLVMRSIMLLIRWGRIPQPPMELMKITGRTARTITMDIDANQLGIEYVGPLALALSNQQAQGSEAWIGKVMQVAQSDPSALDFINWDNALPRWAQAGGVNVDDVATPEQIAAKRAARQKQQQLQQQLAAAQTAGKAYKDSTAAPGAGSPAEALMGAMQ